MRILATLTLLACLLLPAVADGHGSAPHGRLSERELRALETETLGAAHAREHAEQRALLRRPAIRRRIAVGARRARRTAIAGHAAQDAADVGSWAPPVDLPAVAIHAALLPTGKVLFFSKPSENKPVTLYDPATNTTRAVPPPIGDDGPANIFCSSQGFLPDGRLVVMGGNLAYPEPGNPASTYKGLNTVFTFNPFNETWTRQPNMGHGRWYPTQVLMGDGRIMVMDGYDETGETPRPSNREIEVFTPSPDMNGVGTIKRVAVRGGADTPPDGGYYPHMWVMPGGRTLVAGPSGADSWFIDPLGANDGFSWAQAPDPHDHWYGSGVLLPSDTPGSTKVELFGGDVVSSGDRNEVFDAANPGAGWQDAPFFNVHRAFQNTVLLPDGGMVTVGGGEGDEPGTNFKYRYRADQLKIELWDPATGTWRYGPAQQDARTYHGVALLLPDGRVWSAGDDGNDYRGGGPDYAAVHDTAEVYSPPYLFRGPRPAITAAPQTIGYGQTLQVGHAGAVAKAVLVAPGAVTHANDMNQRYVPLPVVGDDGATITLQAPSGTDLAPPGYYMLFLVNAQGVPSVASFVRLGAGTGAGSGPVTGGATTPVGVPAQTPVSAPKARLLKRLRAQRTTVRGLLKRGARVTVTCTRRCLADGRLRLGRRAAGHGSVQLRRAGRKTLVVKVKRSMRRRVKHRRKVVLTLRVRVTDTNGLHEDRRVRIKAVAKRPAKRHGGRSRR